jgi:peptide/nickel transport system substrate-binding protein
MRARFLIALLGALLLFAAPARAQDDKKVFKIGWAQDPQTLSPFVDYDEEDFRIWAINYDLLVNFSPDNLGPAPGLAESWDVSPDKKTVTFHLVKGAKWSDGEPITSKDVKFSLEVLGGNGALFTGYTDNVTSVQTPDAETVIVKTKKPDARIVGGLFIYMLPEHIWGKQSVKALTTTYKPQIPMVGSGPFVVTEFKRNRIIRMERNPNFRGEPPKFDEIQWIKYGSEDAVERALTLGEIDMITEVQAATFDRLSKTKGIKTVKASSPSFTELAFNLCDKQHCPDAKFNPAIQDRTVRQAIGFAVDRERINEIASRNTSFPGHGILPQYYKDYFQEPAGELDYPFDPDRAREMLDAAGWAPGDGGIREKGGQRLSFDLFVRSESQADISAARLVKEMAAEVGVEFKVQVVSVDKLTEVTTRKVDGKMAPEFDTFIWGWGGDPYDPSVLLGLITTSQIGGSSDSFYSNPEYDRLYEEQAGEFDADKRKEIVRQLVEMSQRDLPYLVLTVDPILQAYRTDRLANVSLACPKPGGDVLCDQVSYAQWSTLGPPEPGEAGALASSEDEDSGSGVLYVVIAIAVVVLALVALFVIRRRRRASREAIEV